MIVHILNRQHHCSKQKTLTGGQEWNLLVTGAACLVKDWNRKSFFIQVTCKKDKRTNLKDKRQKMMKNYEEIEGHINDDGLCSTVETA